MKSSKASHTDSAGTDVPNGIQFSQKKPFCVGRDNKGKMLLLQVAKQHIETIKLTEYTGAIKAKKRKTDLPRKNNLPSCSFVLLLITFLLGQSKRITNDVTMGGQKARSGDCGCRVREKPCTSKSRQKSNPNVPSSN